MKRRSIPAGPLGAASSASRHMGAYQRVATANAVPSAGAVHHHHRKLPPWVSTEMSYRPASSVPVSGDRVAFPRMISSPSDQAKKRSAGASGEFRERRMDR
jgi:hypothetical protein